MDHGWATAFAAFMAMREMEEEDRFHKQCAVGISEYSERICSIIADRAEAEGLEELPGELVKGVPFVPLYCFALVLRQQRKVSREQDAVMEIFFRHLSLPFGKSQFVSEVGKGSPLAGFSEKIELTLGNAGVFWKELFRTFHKLDHEEDVDEIIQLCTEIITQFALLGHKREKISPQICYDFMTAAYSQMKTALHLRDNEIDWVGLVPMEERRSKMMQEYRSLMYGSGVVDDVGEEDLMDLFENLFLNSICDIVMMTKKPNHVKLQMIEDLVRYVGAKPTVPPLEYVQDIANQDGVGFMIHNMFSAVPTCGMFWHLLMVMGDKLGSTEQATNFVNQLLNVLLQVEQRMKDQYGDLGAERLASRYIEHILESMIRLVES